MVLIPPALIGVIFRAVAELGPALAKDFYIHGPDTAFDVASRYGIRDSFESMQ